MDVILLKDVTRLGEAGELCRVAEGYARNYLIPQGLAVPATPAALLQMEQKRQAQARREEQLEQDARRLAGQLDGLHLTIRAKTGEKERLYGSVTSGDIAEALEKETGLAVERRKIELEEPIRQLGIYTLPIRLLSDVAPLIRVEVVGEDGGDSDKDQAADEKD
jgi:large subunit ribosomal protein L9